LCWLPVTVDFIIDLLCVFCNVGAEAFYIIEISVYTPKGVSMEVCRYKVAACSCKCTPLSVLGLIRGKMVPDSSVPAVDIVRRRGDFLNDVS
jgi:hypothetical protein